MKQYIICILLNFKVDTDEAQTLINAKDREGLWRINIFIQNMFIDCEKVFDHLHKHPFFF